MNYIETKEKGLKLCDNLLNQGLLTEDEHKACVQAYATRTGIDDIASVALGIPKSKTSAEVSFGMNKKQGQDKRGYDITKKPSFQTFIRSAASDIIKNTDRTGQSNTGGGRTVNNNNKSEYLSVNKELGELFLTDIDPKTNTNAANSIFLVKLLQDGTYTIQVSNTGNYICVNKDNKCTVNNNNVSRECMFKLIGVDNTKYKFESISNPEFFLAAVSASEIYVTDSLSINQVWVLETLGDDEIGANIDSNENIYDSSEAKAIVNGILSEVAAARMRYYGIKSRIEYLALLQSRIIQVIAPEGDIMNYYREIHDSDQTIISDELLQSLAFSISNEVQSREISQISEEIAKLDLEAIKISDAELNVSSARVNKLTALVTSLITERKQSIKDLNLLLDKINARNMTLNDQQDRNDSDLKFYDTQGDINLQNSDISVKRDARNQKEYYLLIGFLVMLAAIILWCGYKLVYKYKTEIL